MPSSDPSILSASQVRKIAALSRLSPTDEEVERYRHQLSAIITYVNRLKELDLTGVEPMAHVGDTTNRLDEDVPGPTLPTATLMAMAPRTWDSFVRVPKVIGEGGGA